MFDTNNDLGYPDESYNPKNKPNYKHNKLAEFIRQKPPKNKATMYFHYTSVHVIYA